MFGHGQQLYGYAIVGTLGYGAHSTVYQVKDRKGALYALKHTLAPDAASAGAIRQATHEHEIAQKLDHVGLRKSYRLIKPFSFGKPRKIANLMELVIGRPLSEVKEPSLRQMCQWFRAAAEALEEMHRSGYIHADIKPANIMITEDRQVKIIDYGQACPTGTVKERMQGTPDFMAPEQTYRGKIMPYTDVFNLGASMYLTFTKMPLPNATAASYARPGTRKSESSAAPHEMDADIPPALGALVMECIAHDPAKRPATMKDVIRRLTIAEQVLDNATKRTAS